MKPLITKEEIKEAISIFPRNNFAIINQIVDYHYHYCPDNKTWFLLYNKNDKHYKRYFKISNNCHPSYEIDSCVWNAGGELYSLEDFQEVCNIDFSPLENLYWGNCKLDSYYTKTNDIINSFVFEYEDEDEDDER